jgi:hypothetical protein
LQAKIAALEQALIRSKSEKDSELALTSQKHQSEMQNLIKKHNLAV